MNLSIKSVFLCFLPGLTTWLRVIIPCTVQHLWGLMNKVSDGGRAEFGLLRASLPRLILGASGEHKDLRCWVNIKPLKYEDFHQTSGPIKIPFINKCLSKNRCHNLVMEIVSFNIYNFKSQFLRCSRSNVFIVVRLLQISSEAYIFAF